MGHLIEMSHNTALFEIGQIIRKDIQTNIYIGGTEHHSDSLIAYW